MPERLEFCNERVPLERPDIKESFDRELLVNTYWQSQALLFIKRSHKWFPIIEPILKKNNVPDDFKYLAVIESGLTNAVSPAGARGFWQFMKSSGKEFGLEISDEVDERYHVEKSTEAACKYLKKSYAKFGNWTLAAASYNCGIAGLSRQLKKQNQDSYYDLLLNSETGRYVYRIVAVKEILDEPKKYGFQIRKKDLYYLEPTLSIEIDTSIEDLVGFCDTLSINYKQLKYYNPWLRKPNLRNPNSKKYQFKIPKLASNK